MGKDRENWDIEWSGLEPKRQRFGRWGCWLGLVLLILLLLAICGMSGYLAWQEFGHQLGPGLVLMPPTALSSEPDTAEAETPQPLTAEPPSLAATVTLATTPTAGSVEAAQMPTMPLIDGSLDEWVDVSTFESSYLVYSDDEWDGTDDVTATWRLGWDSSNLFVAIQVEDNTHVQTQTGNQIFRGDSLSMQFDSNVEGDFGPQLSSDDYQINLSPGDFATIPPSTFRFRGTSDGGAVDATGHSIVAAAQQTEHGYNLEAVIPWRDIGLSPAVGLEIGAAFNVNDNDTPGTAVQEVMKSHVATRAFRDPTSWGSLVLR